jgi:phosphate-selective porin OprO/OprP
MVLCCWVGTFPLGALAQGPTVATPGTLLIRNVTLIDQKGDTEDTLVNILIQDKQLELITQDEISRDTAEMAMDAKKGILLGKLELGETANFMILDGDPREDFQILLDTATHVLFAIKDGVIVRNWLMKVLGSDEKPKRSGWLAYTPPPIALPSSYKDKRKWNRWETRYISGIFTGALALDRQNWQTQDSKSKAQVGDLDDSDGGEVRALRFGVVGTLNFPQPWVYTVFAATNGFTKGFDTDDDDDLTLFDWRLDIPFFAETTISLGKQKEPISLERSMGMIYLPMQERSAVSDAMLPSRNIGILLSGMAFNQRMTWASGAFNNWLDPDSSGTFSENASQFIGRVTGLPFISEDESNLLHLGFGLRYTNAEKGLFYSTEPEFDQSPSFVNTGAFAAKSSLTYNFEASWRKGPFWLLGEYVYNDVNAPDQGNPNFTGYFVAGTWALTGEMRTYNHRSGTFSPLPVAQSVYQGGWGAWEVGARWSNVDLTDGRVKGGEMQIASVGLNWWLTSFFKVDFNYRWIMLDRFGVDSDSTGFNTRILLILE